jgi:hypothetical protein
MTSPSLLSGVSSCVGCVPAILLLWPGIPCLIYLPLVIPAICRREIRELPREVYGLSQCLISLRLPYIHAPFYAMSKVQRAFRLSDSWLFEIVSILISLLSIVAISALLAYYNGKLLFKWHNVTLNTVISVFATLARISLILAVSSSIGQWRWNWFLKRPRRLADIDVLDSASRGSFGSLQLVWTTRSW